jgi:precorrin-2 dehydrogenase/sirohydrochlorin ferrochelatase
VSGLPILVEAAALRVLVVGGGAVASRKVRALADAGAHLRLVSPQLGAEMERLVAEYAISVERRPFAPGDVGDAELVIAATSDRSVNAAVAREAREAHRLVNVADRPEEGSFATMATHREGALVVGVSAGGVPGAAARIRDAISERFDTRYARALGALATLRRSLLARGDGASWRALSSEVIGADFCAAVESDGFDERVASWR